MKDYVMNRARCSAQQIKIPMIAGGIPAKWHCLSDYIRKMFPNATLLLSG